MSSRSLACAGILVTVAATAHPAQPSFQGLGDLLGGDYHSMARAVSADGSTVVGCSNSTNGDEAFRWTKASGMVGLGDLPGGSFRSDAYELSADGSVVVGLGRSSASYPHQEAFRWTENTGLVPLGDLPGGDYYSSASGVSAYGSVVGGDSGIAYPGGASHKEVYRWTEAKGMIPLGASRGPETGASEA